MRSCVLVVVAVVVAAVVHGCGSPPVELPRRGLPAGVSVGVEQTRADMIARRIQIRFVNDSNTQITVTRAALGSQRLTAPAAWSGSTDIAPGATRNLAVEMPPATCEDGPIGDVTVFYADQVGAARDIVKAEDRFSSVSEFMDRDCSQRQVESIAKVTPEQDIRVQGVGEDSRAYLDLLVRPTGRGGQLTLVSVDETVLLTSPDGEDWQLGTEIGRSSQPQRVSLPIEPARCDAHAVAEDKVGTLLTLHSRIGRGEDLSYHLALNEAHRAQLLAFVADHCEFGK